MTDATSKQTFSTRRAHETQRRLSKQIIFKDTIPKKIRWIGGIDVAYSGEVSIGAVAVLDFDNLKLEESQTATCPTRFPYVPTMLSFREIPPAVNCIGKLHIQPDVFLVDGHGYAHPFRCGFASHLGLVIGKPTIGVAKRILVGHVDTQENNHECACIRDKNEVIGAQIRRSPELKPVYVSIGHMISLETAVQIVKHCIVNQRLPKPILEAHKIATAEKHKKPIFRNKQ